MQEEIEMIQLKLTPEEVQLLKESLGSSVYYAPDLEELHRSHPGDIVDWGKHLQTTGSILMKIKEATDGAGSKKKKSK
jgi:hypothetical protein